MDNISWGCCAGDNGDDPFTTCTECSKVYHLNCLLLPSKTVQNDWICPLCRSTTPKPVKNDNTPTRNVTTTRGNKKKSRNSSPSEVNPEPAITRSDVRDIVREVMQSQLKEMITTLNGNIMDMLCRELKPLKEEMSEIVASMTFLNGQYEDLVKENKVVKQAISDLKQKFAHLSSTHDTRIKLLENIVEEQSRQLIGNMLEIRNVPWSPKETKADLSKTTLEVIQVVAPQFTSSDILEVRRLPSKTEKKTILVSVTTNVLKRNIILATRDFNAKRQGNPLNTTIVAPHRPRENIYIDEHLTSKGKHLYFLARQLKKKGHYKFCWTANGKILIREKEGANAIHVTEETQLSDLTNKKDLNSGTD